MPVTLQLRLEKILLGDKADERWQASHGEAGQDRGQTCQRKEFCESPEPSQFGNSGGVNGGSGTEEERGLVEGVGKDEAGSGNCCDLPSKPDQHDKDAQ